MTTQPAPSIGDELAFLAAQIDAFMRLPTKHTWSDRRAFFGRAADQLRELAEQAELAGADARVAA